MDTTKLSSKGQIILPKAVREANGWQAGIEFSVEQVAEGVLLRPLHPFAETRLEDVIGCAGYKGARKSLDDMARAIEDGVRARRAGGRY
jgi:AbrB family looped-hinge helix DNA binding protein